MATMAATRHHHHLHDPFACDRGRFLSPSSSPSDPSSHLLLDLLAVDDLVDSSRAARQIPPYERLLLDELLAVDLEFALADVRDRGNVCTAPCRRDEREIFLDLLYTDMEVDRRSPAGGGTVALHDAYARKASAVEGMRRHKYDHHDDGDDEVMMRLLAVDEEVDGGRRHGEDAASDEYAIISELHEVDREVGGAKARALVVEDLRCLLEVDRMMDGHNPRSTETSSGRAKKTRGRPIVHRRIRHASDADAAGRTHRHHHHLHDPYDTREDHRFRLFSAIADPSAHILTDLLAVDRLVDSRAGASPPYERVLLDELLAVDLEFALADVRLRGGVCTAPCRRDEREIFLDLLHTDMEVDRRSPAGGGAVALHDAYARVASAGTCRRARDDIRDYDEVMMRLLAVDEEVDGGRRHGEDAASDEYAIISELHDVDREVGSAKARALVVEDLGCLLEVDRMMDRHR